MAVQDQLLAALDDARNKAVQLRNEHMLKRGDYDRDLQEIDSALGILENRLRNLTYQRDECQKSARTLSNAWLDMRMPESIVIKLREKQDQLDAFDSRIKGVQDSQAQLMERRGDKNADCQLEARDQEKFEAELKEIDQRIAEIRGF